MQKMEPDVVLLTNSVQSLEDISITAWMMVANRCLVGHRLESLHAVQDTLAGLLRDSLGGVSSINTRSKMMQKLVDVRFLIALSKEHSAGSSSVNKVLTGLFPIILSSDLPKLNLSCKTISSDLQDAEDELMNDENDYLDTPEFHVNVGEIIKHLTNAYKRHEKVKLKRLELQGCYIGRMHGGFQMALTKLFEIPPPDSFSYLTQLYLRDFLEPLGTPTKRHSNRVRLCRAIGSACHNLETLNIGNLDLGAILHIFIRSPVNIFQSIKTDTSPLLVVDQVNQDKNSVSIQDSLTIPTSEDLQPLCSTLQILVVSLRDSAGRYSGLTLAPFFIRFLPAIQILHMDGVDNAIVGGLALGLKDYETESDSHKMLNSIRTTRITSADWFNPDINRFNKQLGLPHFTFQDGLNLLCSKCPHLMKLTLGKTLLLEFSHPIRIPREPFTCRSLLPLENLKFLTNLTTQCIPAILLVPLIQSIGSQLKLIDIRLHMQASGQLSSNLLLIFCKNADFNLQITGRPLTRGDFLRQESFLLGGQGALQEVEERIREEGLDEVIVEDF
eukprot:GFUD01018137.1.p1 GENE.GFUD01018137.1~~GFUD01018137.1.p1  ORF type:complete len:556 (-),score=107.62 GFUD01018137.1:36-1703(-)